MSRAQFLMNRFYPESRFGGFTRFDGTIAFYSRVQALLRPEYTLVDFGCGRGAYQDDPLPFRRDLHIFKGKVQRVIGLDVNPAAGVNPYLDEFHLLEGNHWPLTDNSADLIVADQVLEHLADPAAFFSEAARVLKPGGVLSLRTPNRWNYIALISRIVPNRLHARLLGSVKSGLQEQDVFPTLYRCNTPPALRAAFRHAGLDGVVIAIEPEPSYLSFSSIAYALGVFYQRWSPAALRAVLLAFSKKPI